MKRQTFAAVAMGLVIGAVSCGRWAENAPAQSQPAVQQWEFRVEDFGRVGGSDQAERLAALYEDDWEYVGLLTAGSRGESGPGGTVAFKRQKVNRSVQANSTPWYNWK